MSSAIDCVSSSLGVENVVLDGDIDVDTTVQVEWRGGVELYKAVDYLRKARVKFTLSAVCPFGWRCRLNGDNTIIFTRRNRQEEYDPVADIIAKDFERDFRKELYAYGNRIGAFVSDELEPEYHINRIEQVDGNVYIFGDVLFEIP